MCGHLNILAVILCGDQPALRVGADFFLLRWDLCSSTGTFLGKVTKTVSVGYPGWESWKEILAHLR